MQLQQLHVDKQYIYRQQFEYSKPARSHQAGRKVVGDWGISEARVRVRARVRAGVRARLGPGWEIRPCQVKQVVSYEM